MVKQFRDKIMPFFESVFNKGSKSWKGKLSIDVSFLVHKDLEFVDNIQGHPHKTNIRKFGTGPIPWYILKHFGLLVKPFPNDFKTRIVGNIKHLEFSDHPSAQQTMPLTLHQCIKAMLLCDLIPKLKFDSEDIEVETTNWWNFFDIANFVMAIDQTATTEINFRHEEEDSDSDNDEIDNTTLSNTMKPIEAFTFLEKTFKDATLAHKKKMFSNSVAELMIAQNDETEADVMPCSLSEPLLDALQNVATRADNDNTRYSFSAKNKKKKQSTNRASNDWGQSSPNKKKRRRN